jgi:hypothetical protein
MNFYFFKGDVMNIEKKIEKFLNEEISIEYTK